MREKAICLADKNEKYIVKLVDYINSHHSIPYRAYAFTSVEAIKDFAGKYDIPLLVLDADMISEVDEKIAEKIVCFVEQRQTGDDEIYKFQVADYLAKDIIAQLEEEGNIFGDYGNILTVYSPATKSFRTTVAVGLAILKGWKGKCLFVSFEQYASLNTIMSIDRGSLSEALYWYKTLGDKAYAKIVECIGNNGKFDYLYPVKCPDDIGDFTLAELAGFCNFLKERGGYEYIIIDAGDCFSNPWKLFEFSSEIIVTIPPDITGRQKIHNFFEYLEKSDKSYVLSKIQKVEIPYYDNLQMDEITPDWIEKKILPYLDWRE